jgi:hypothetical protein
MSTPVTPSGEPDPIVATMERHRAARLGALDAYDRLGVLQEMIPEARRRWQISLMMNRIASDEARSFQYH